MRPPLALAALCLLLPAMLAADPACGADGSGAPSPAATAAAQERPALDLGRYLTPLELRPTSRVTLVLDGDTLRLADRRSVRLACIDAPDLALSPPLKVSGRDGKRKNFYVEPGTVEDRPEPPRASEQRFAAAAHGMLRSAALKRTVTLMAPSSRRDPQGRLVCDAVLDDGVSLSGLMVSRGLAYVVRDPEYPEDYLTALFQLQAEAIAARRGFWGVILSLEAARQPWIGSSESGLFYSSRDVRGQQIKPRLRVYFGTLLDAFSQGFAPASSRDFWPQAN